MIDKPSDQRKKTIATYDQSAREFSEYFSTMNRSSDISIAFDLIGNPKGAKVLELGCGDGRDAKEILKRTNNYIGVDVSKGLINLARENNPGRQFLVADMTTFDYPKDLDLIFAFASVLHVDQGDLRQVFDKAYTALRTGGGFYISSKFASKFEQKWKVDKFGKRLFYYYNPDIIRSLVGDRFAVVHVDRDNRSSTSMSKPLTSQWFQIALRKR